MNLNSFYSRFKIIPKNNELYEMAFTHPSFNANLKNIHIDYQRLEFLGDSILGFVVASMIFKHYPSMSEGDMTKVKISLVQRDSLAKKALDNDFDKYIRLGNSLNAIDLEKNNHILEDIFEAIIGAIYIDQGLDFVISYIEEMFVYDVEHFKDLEIKDYKSLLQEAMQADYRESVKYEVVSYTGACNNRTFNVEVSFNGQILGKGSGKSKKAAEQAAAKDALSKAVK